MFPKFISSLVLVLFLFPLDGYSQKKKTEEPEKIPKEIADIINANLPTRQTRLDIPLSYVKTLYFPFQNDFFSCFFFKIKDQALGYTALSLEEKKTESEKKGKKKKKEARNKVVEKEEILLCQVDFFFRIYSMNEDGRTGEITREIWLPWSDQVRPEEYNSEEENIYSFGTIFPPGRYLLCAAAASPDLTKIGLTFQEFYLPVASDFRQYLELTPLFFMKSVKNISSPDTFIKIYKNFFHYVTLEIEPFFDHEFSPSEKLDILYYILGGTPSGEGKYDFEINYIYKKGEEEVAKFKPHILKDIPAPIVSLQLPLLIKEKELEAGDYVLEIKAKDNIGEKEGTGKIHFVVK
jgi:hypothetical protein